MVGLRYDVGRGKRESMYSQCFVTFYEQFCVIQDLKTRKVLGLGKKKASLYHLLNLPLDQIHAQLSFMVVSALEDCSLYSFFSNCSVPNNYAFSVFNNKYSLWNHRLGHVSNTTLKHIPVISKCVSHAANESCLTCPMTKFAKLPYSFSDSHAKTPFQLVHIDIWGPYKVFTLGHHKYFLTIVDDCSRAVWTFLLIKKSGAYPVFKTFINFVKTQFEKEIKLVRSDNALEFLQGSLGPLMKSLGIEHQTSCVERPQQNGRGDCVITATYLINRIRTAILKFKTPYEVLLSSEPTYEHLRVFGCLVVASNPSRVADKFVSRDVVFYEHIFPCSKTSMSQILQPIPAPVSSPIWYEEFVNIEQVTTSSTDSTPEPDAPNSSPSIPEETTTSTDPIPEPEFKPVLVPNTPVQPEVTRKSSRVLVQPNWCKAIDDELRALEENHTWEVTSLLVDKKAIPCHWIYKTKLKADGSLDRKKARLVINGNRQRKGVDYEETFAPVVKMVTLRALLVVAAMNGWDTCQMDVSNAFLHGDLTEEVYMQMPQGYVGKGEKVQDASSSLVCRLKKSLYGLKQAPRQWFAKLSSALLSFGYVQSKADYSFFIKSNTSSFTTVLAYVDDLLITDSSQTEIQHLKSQLRIFISQKKYTLDLLKDAGLSNAKSYKLPMDPHVKLKADSGTPLPDPEIYRRYIDILLAHKSAVQLTVYCDSDWASCPMKRRSSAEPEYREMALTCCKVTWLVSLLKDLGLKDLGPVDLKCDNKAAIYMAANPVFHARTKHIEIDCHYVRDQIKRGEVLPYHVSTKSQ
ncbi:retrovirus-related pol polyprotein from transposon TNT 1-94 [Tanacetum coccineum]